MEVLKIRPDQKEFFSHLDPYGFMSVSGLPGAFALGAVEKDDDDNDIPVGLCIFRLISGALRIEWIAVDENYQMEGIGDELCYSVVETARQIGLSRVEAAFYENPGRGDLCEGEREYFIDKGFEKDGGKCSYAKLDLSEIKKLPFFENSKGVKKLIPISKMPSVDIKKLADELPAKKHFGTMSAMENIMPAIDKDFSFVIQSSDGTAGGILVYSSEGVLTPVALGADDDVLISALLYTALDAASKSDEHSQVLVISSDHTWENMMETVLGQHQFMGSILVYELK